MSDFTAQLFIMPFAGGSKAAFQTFEDYIKKDIQVITIEYPGRGSRIREPFCQSMDDLILDVKTQIKDNRVQGLPFALMGYSMGCEITFDLAQYVLNEQADLLIFCARESIQYDTKGHDYTLLDQAEFEKKIIEFGGIEDKIINNPRFFEIAMRPIYADYKLLHQYRYHADKGLLKQDIMVFYCDSDTPKEKIMGWMDFTTGKADFYEMGNNHFFINGCEKEMAELINERMQALR